MKTLAGSLHYIAPEVIARSYKMSCDLWSLGVIAYSSLTGSFPYIANSPEDMFYAIWLQKLTFKDDVKSRVSKTSRRFIRRLLRKNPEKRLNCK
jgi:serine/threonine protein kinase